MGMAVKSASTIARGAAHISKRLVLSYVWDWVCILGIAGVGGAFNKIHTTSKRVFALQDPSISYPYKEDTVTFEVLILVGLVAPAAITLILTFLFVPGGGAPTGTSPALIWRRKLWEWNTAWMGLALALASAFMITEGLKDLAGKPRPHAIAVCRPNLDNIAQYQVGGLGTQLQGGAVPIMVDYRICQETDAATMRNVFASWPSGHSSFAWAGLLYLSFWVSSKFAVTIPLLLPSTTSNHGRRIPTFNISSPSKSPDSGSTQYDQNDTDELFHRHTINPPRNQAAAPPVYLLIIVFVPIGTAAFIAVSRWFDYHHHGFDIISGSLLGIFTAWFSFRYYHLPIRRGAGWSWGARSRERAFWLGVGRDSYVGEEGWESKKFEDNHKGERLFVEVEQTDVEAGKNSRLGRGRLDVASGNTGNVHQDGGVPGPSAM